MVKNLCCLMLVLDQNRSRRPPKKLTLDRLSALTGASCATVNRAAQGLNVGAYVPGGAAVERVLEEPDKC